MTAVFTCQCFREEILPLGSVDENSYMWPTIYAPARIATHVMHMTPTLCV